MAAHLARNQVPAASRGGRETNCCQRIALASVLFSLASVQAGCIAKPNLIQVSSKDWSRNPARVHGHWPKMSSGCRIVRVGMVLRDCWLLRVDARADDEINRPCARTIRPATSRARNVCRPRCWDGQRRGFAVA